MNTRTCALLIGICTAAYMPARQNMHERIRSFDQEMTEWIQESRKEMQELFDSLDKGISSFSHAHQSGVELSFENTDNQLYVRVQLPEQVQVDTQSISAEMEDNTVMLHIPYNDGHLDVEVAEATIEVMSKHAMKHTSDKDDDKAAYSYTAQSQMTHSLPARIHPASIKKHDQIVIDHDEKSNILTLTFDKKQRTEKVQVKTQKHASDDAQDTQKESV